MYSSGIAPALLSCCPAWATSGGVLFRLTAKEDGMRMFMVVVALAVGMSAYGALPAAAEEKADPKATGALVERLQDLNLTEEQEAKIADIRKECKPKVQEAAKELAGIVKEEVTKVQAVLTEEQKTKLAELKEERKEFRAERLAERIAHLQDFDLTDAELARFMEIRQEYHPKIVKALEGLKGILTDEQRKAREEALKANKNRKEVLAAINLTDQQKEKVEAVAKDLHTLVRESLEKMRDVLTEGQKEKLQELKEERRERVRDRMACRIANLKDLNLTDEQKEKIMEIRKEYRPKVQEAGNKLRATIREEVESILAVTKG
jgi:Spy/CpxP family protein refolding chaperone